MSRWLRSAGRLLSGSLLVLGLALAPTSGAESPKPPEPAVAASPPAEQPAEAKPARDATRPAEAKPAPDATRPAEAKPARDAARPADPAAAPARDPLLDPASARKQAPDVYRVRLVTTKGPILIEVRRAWAPLGADRFYNLVDIGFYDDVAFFRVIDGFMAQFGLHGRPAVSARWGREAIRDDPVVESNKRGMVTFAKTARPHSRTTQLFINLSDNPNLDQQGFAPIGRVVEGMDVVDAIFKIGEGAPRGHGPAQQQMRRVGNVYLRNRFPKLDYVTRAEIVD